MWQLPGPVYLHSGHSHSWVSMTLTRFRAFEYSTERLLNGLSTDHSLLFLLSESDTIVSSFNSSTFICLPNPGLNYGVQCTEGRNLSLGAYVFQHRSIPSENDDTCCIKGNCIALSVRPAFNLYSFSPYIKELSKVVSVSPVSIGL